MEFNPSPQHRALSITEKLYTYMLPISEDMFREELRLWHPDLDARSYLLTKGYPRCWIVTVALILAVEFPEYTRALFEHLRYDPTLVHPFDDERVESISTDWLLTQAQESWRETICRVGSFLYFSGPRTPNRAFVVGLRLAFSRPETSGSLAAIIRGNAPDTYQHQVTLAAAVIRSHPMSFPGSMGR